MIRIIDYGLGNIKAIQHIYKQLNIDCSIARTGDQLSSATKVILPGVGSFDFAMSSLQASGMREVLDALILEKEIPILGICVGMQMLANTSEEGKLPGLGYVEAMVKKFDRQQLGTRPLPHMGWNVVSQQEDNSLFKNIPSRERFYFLHSYYFDCTESGDIIADAFYGLRFCCAVSHKNIYGVQFHPEKSHSAGVNLLRNFGMI